MDGGGNRSAGVLLAGLLISGCGGAPEPERPDLLVITVDTLRPDHVGAYGHGAARTPNMDALAARGLRFTQATTPFPRTTPAIASLFSGLWPQHHGSREVGEPMRDVPTLASLLRAAGYSTAGVSATDVLSSREGIDAGFTELVSRRMHAADVTDEVLRLGTAQSTDAPAFLWAHYFDPHFPYVPWPGWGEQPEAPACRALMEELLIAKTISWADIQQDRYGKASRALDDCRRLYDAEIAYVDHEIGRLLEGVTAMRGDRPTLIVFTADHGENLGEGGLFYEHGPNVHDASLRIPLILAGPGVRVGVDDRVARLEDLLPTVLGLLGVERSTWPEMDGGDLMADPGPVAAYAEGGTSLYPRYTGALTSGRRGGVHCIHDSRHSLCEGSGDGALLFDHVDDPDFRRDLGTTRPGARAALERAREIWPPETARQRSVRTPELKLVEFPALQGGYRRELYDLRSDPAETRDVSGRRPADLRRLAALLERWTADLTPAPGRRDRTPEELEKLRSLGYVN